MHHYANLAEIGQSIAEISRFFYFSRWQPSAMLNLLCARLDHSRMAFGGRYHCAEFGWNRRSSLHNMRVHPCAISRCLSHHARKPVNGSEL